MALMVFTDLLYVPVFLRSLSSIEGNQQIHDVVSARLRRIVCWSTPPAITWTAYSSLTALGGAYASFQKPRPAS